MAYLDNSIISVDCILTQKGRELLAKGSEFFNITQFALSDDEIDYTLWDPTHPSGSAYYGKIIENMPLLEAFPDETQMMKYKLVTLPKSTYRIPVVSVAGGRDIILPSFRSEIIITPQTTPPANTILGYTAILANSDAAELIVPPEGQIQGLTVSATKPVFLDDIPATRTEEQFQRRSVSAVGLKFRLIAKLTPLADILTQLTIIGNETGGQTTLNVLVKKNKQSDPASPTPSLTPGSGRAGSGIDKTGISNLSD